MDRAWTTAKAWLGLKKLDEPPAPWFHLKSGILTGVICAAVAAALRGPMLAGLMLIGWTVVGLIYEGQARYERRNAR